MFNNFWKQCFVTPTCSCKSLIFLKTKSDSNRSSKLERKIEEVKLRIVLRNSQTNKEGTVSGKNRCLNKIMLGSGLNCSDYFQLLVVDTVYGHAHVTNMIRFVAPSYNDSMTIGVLFYPYLWRSFKLKTFLWLFKKLGSFSKVIGLFWEICE